MRKHEILYIAHLNEEIKRIEDLVQFYPDIRFYNTSRYETYPIQHLYGVRFGHLDTLKFIHAPYSLLFRYYINDDWLLDFQRAAKNKKQYCGIFFQ